MFTDTRAQAAKYYDLSPDVPADIPFYRGLIPSSEGRLLELGCGTGRVLVPLAEACGYIHGLDRSEAMVAVCRRRLNAAGVASTKAQAEVQDITNFALDQKFDLIIAPYRVLQNLETDSAVTGLFGCIRRHLIPGGNCVLNVFRPHADRETLCREWCTEQEKLCWEVDFEQERVTCHDRRPRMDRDKMILYPELIYRQYRGNALLDEVTLNITMRCYYPEEFVQLIVDHGFRVLQQWGGYAGEPYGLGSELVVQFTHARG